MSIYDGAGQLLLVERVSALVKDPTAHRFDCQIGLAPGAYRIAIRGWEKSRGEVRLTVGTVAATAAVSLTK